MFCLDSCPNTNILENKFRIERTCPNICQRRNCIWKKRQARIKLVKLPIMDREFCKVVTARIVIHKVTKNLLTFYKRNVRSKNTHTTHIYAYMCVYRKSFNIVPSIISILVGCNIRFQWNFCFPFSSLVFLSSIFGRCPLRSNTWPSNQRFCIVCTEKLNLSVWMPSVTMAFL